MSFTLSDVYASVDLRTARVARTKQMPEVATNTTHRDLLFDYLKEGGHIACREIPQLTARQRWLSTVGQGCYSVTSNLQSTRKCTFEGKDLDLVDAHEARVRAENENNARPTEFGVGGNELWLAPAPNISKEIILFYRPNNIIAENDHSILTNEYPAGEIMNIVPDAWKPNIVNYLLYKWYTDLEVADQAELRLQEWNQWLVDDSVDRQGAKTTLTKARYF